MYFDLNIPIPSPSTHPSSKKGKGKQDEVFNSTQVDAIEARIDLLVHLGYTALGFAHTVNKRVEKTHVNILDSLLPQLRKRDGVLYLKRLNIILDGDSEKGFGLINASIPMFDTYDIIALIPTTQATFSLACLTHSQPSPLTAHIIALPLTLPRLSFHMKHTLVRTAIKNGSVFEINYVGALGGQQDAVIMEAGVGEVAASAKRNWWAAAGEIVRVTKGKSLLLSGGVASVGDLRAPRDVGNLVTMLGLPQDAAHAMSTTNAKSLVLRAQTRKTYRAVFSEPRLVVPADSNNQKIVAPSVQTQQTSTTGVSDSAPPAEPLSKKRTLEDTVPSDIRDTNIADKQAAPKKKKQKKNRHRNTDTIS